MSLSTQLVRLLDIKKTNTKLRLHSTAQRKKALRVFERQGIVAPIILDELFNILDGNLRFEIVQELGWKSLNCVILRGLSEVQKKELSVTLNRLSEDSKWDPIQLKLHLEAILDFEADLSFTGLEQAEIDTALSFQVVPEQEPEDLTPPLNTVSKIGDLWRIGDHLLICGDSLTAQDLLAPHMNGPAKLLCTARSWKWYKDLTKGKVKSLQELAKMERTSVETITRNLPLSNLKPDQIERLLKGQHTPDLSVAKLIKNPALL